MLTVLAHANDWTDRLLSTQVLWPIVMTTIYTAWIVSKTLVSILNTQARERYRREIAAYIAEGAMAPEQGERLMRAGIDHKTAA